MSLAVSEAMQKYFDTFKKDCFVAYEIAQKMREKGYDPDNEVEVTLAETLAERVVGLISVIAPQIKGSGADKRIVELEKEYGILDWRVAMVIAHEIAQEKYCQFKSKLEAIEVGVRVGFAYVTLGVVSSPIEGLTGIEILPRRDGKGEFFRLNFAGPVRNAGGTAAAVSVLVADYVRKKMGYAKYDPDEKEMERCPAELEDYHGYVANLQYWPSKEESIFLMKHIPVEIAGDPSEKRELSNVNLKDLPRIETNNLRSGYCLIHSSCIPLKSPKLWKRLNDWGEEMGMEDWNFLKEYCELQKKAKSKGKKKEGAKITPDYTYIKDLVAGRPVLAHPLRRGGLRLRYGRGRASGYSGQSIHPATMVVLDDFVAIGTQLKVERPGKAASFTPCDCIEGPIVRLFNGSVKYLGTEEEARKYKKQVEEILYLGDVLINYGDFFDRAHPLVPAGYNEEYWIQELKKAIKEQNLTQEQLAQKTNIPQERLNVLLEDFFYTKPTFNEAYLISQTLAVPLHPFHTHHWGALKKEEHLKLLEEIKQHDLIDYNVRLELSAKPYLELVGLPHKKTTEHILIEGDHAKALLYLYGHEGKPYSKTQHDTIKKQLEEIPAENIIDWLNTTSVIPIRDKSGIFIGARMGRPEKAKMRKLKGSPHTLFPVGEEGGRLRSFQAALEAKKIKSAFPIKKCVPCNIQTPLNRCEMCDSETIGMFYCKMCGVVSDCPHEEKSIYSYWDVPIERIWKQSLKMLGMRVYPDLIKGVRGTSNSSHIPEHVAKGILRAKHNIHVNKDGTIRYDASEVTLTHFKPREVGAPVEKLIELGYTHDVKGKPLEHDDQVLEIMPQDVVLPCLPNGPDEPCDDVLFRTTKFVDDLLVNFYKSEPFYNLKNKQELIGHYIIGLAPHTSAGIVGRIVGMSKAQGFLAHPLFHAAMRRDCFSYNTYLPIKKNGVWSNKQIGELVEELNPQKVVDAHGTQEIKPTGYKTLGLVNGNIQEVSINNFTRHSPRKFITLKTKLGRTITTTTEHKHITVQNKKNQIVRANQLKAGDTLKLPYNFSIKEKEQKTLDLIDMFAQEEWVMVKGLEQHVDLKKELKKLDLTKSDINNYSTRKSVPMSHAIKIITQHKIPKKTLKVSAKRDHITTPAIIPLDENFLKIIGLYVAEGYARESKEKKGFYQVYIAAAKPEIRTFVKKYFSTWGLKPSEKKEDRVTYSSRILYELIKTLGCGARAHNKRIPQKFLTLPIKKIGHILSGYLEGDGSVSENDLRITFDTVSEGLLQDIQFLLSRMGIFLKRKTYTKKPGPQIRAFYERKQQPIPGFTITKGIIQSKFVHQFSQHVGFISEQKKTRHEQMLKKRFRNLFCEYDEQYFYDEITSIEEQPEQTSYCLNVPGNTVIANGILTKQCDGDESCFLLLMDTFLNFSRKYLPESRGGTMDAPLVLTYWLNPAEVDDMAFNVDTVWEYPLEFHEAAQQFKMPWDVKIERIEHHLGTPRQFEKMGFTHPTTNLNAGVLCSAYKTLPSMAEKLEGQLKLAKKIRACDAADVAQLVITKHFMRDTKGNLRKFSQQQFRCVGCNEKYRRPPLRKICKVCNGKIIFTISQGSVIKYLEPSLKIAHEYNVAPYLIQTLELTKLRIDEVFGKEPDRQEGLDKFFG